MLLFPSPLPQAATQDVLERKSLALRFSPSAQSSGLATGGCRASVGASNWREVGRWGGEMSGNAPPVAVGCPCWGRECGKRVWGKTERENHRPASVLYGRVGRRWSGQL